MCTGTGRYVPAAAAGMTSTGETARTATVPAGEREVTSWSWTDPEGLVYDAANKSWQLTVSGGQNVAALLPCTITVQVQGNATGETSAPFGNAEPVEQTLAVSWDLPKVDSTLQAGGYRLTASLPEGYVLAEGTQAPGLLLRVTSDGTPASAETSAPAQQADDVLTDAVSPVGTTINLFDYWITGQFEPDNVDPANLDQGINAGHLLWFLKNAYNQPNPINNYTGSARPRTGIVRNLLQNGYPALTEDDQSLAYLFNPSLPNAGKASYPGVRDLLQIDAQGYYYYDSAQNFAQYNQSTNSFILYSEPGVNPSGASPRGQFFPFNQFSQVKNLTSTNPVINHYFGMTMTTRFVQQPYGTVDGTAGGTPVTYEFTGDDDVWVFIDDVLVGDLGGIHDAASLSINFQNGQVQVNGSPNGTIREKFEAAGKTWPNPGSDTFADDTYHTLKFFYLERGNFDSNMKLKFNLVSIPQSDLIKIDQIGDPVPGAEFRLYYAGEDYSYSPQDLIATGTTGPNGYFVFQNPDGTLLSLNNLKNEYGGTGKTGKFVLVETNIPQGYRAPPQIDLYSPEDYPNLATLLSANPWDTGAYASPVVTVTLPDEPRGIDGTPYPADDGTYFAVVLKRQGASGDGGSTQSDWYPVSGDPITGWKVSSSTGIEAAIQAARANPYLFTLDSSGAYKATIDNLPGDILTYHYVLATNGRLTPDNAQYTVAFYRTTAPTLAGADAANTVRLDADAEGQDGNFAREFSVRLFVPDIKNYFFVQKVGEDDDTTLTGAVFALYQAGDVTDGQVNPGAQPYDTVTTKDQSQEQGDIITLNGSGTFPNTRDVIPAGTYYIKEITAPDGYAPSDQLVEVVVDDTGVYADAGTPDDDVAVLRGVGKVVRSMLQFAVPDDINATLTDIKAALYTANSYTPGTGDDPAVWTASGLAPLDLSYYSNSQILEYGPTDPGGPVYYLVNAGWSRLGITQNYAAGTDQDLKINLGDQDLTNIFSRSTIVRFRDDPTRLTVEKKVTGAGADREKDFAFTLMLTGEDGMPVTGEHGGLEFDAEGIARTTLRDGQSIVIEGLDPGTVCTVTETPETAYATTVALNGGAQQSANTITVTLPAGGTKILFINRSTLPEPTPTPVPDNTQTVTATGERPSATRKPVLGLLPATGDATLPGVWLALCLASAGGLGAVLRLRRRRRR